MHFDSCNELGLVPPPVMGVVFFITDLFLKMMKVIKTYYAKGLRNLKWGKAQWGVKNLAIFVRLCYEESDDPVNQDLEINKRLLDLKDSIPGYVDVSLMIFPRENSKVFEYRAKRQFFVQRITPLMDIEAVNEKEKKQLRHILNGPDFSIGRTLISQHLINLLFKVSTTEQESRKSIS